MFATVPLFKHFANNGNILALLALTQVLLLFSVLLQSCWIHFDCFCVLFCFRLCAVIHFYAVPQIPPHFLNLKFTLVLEIGAYFLIICTAVQTTSLLDSNGQIKPKNGE